MDGFSFRRRQQVTTVFTFPPFLVHTVKHTCWEFPRNKQVSFYYGGKPEEFDVPCGRKRKLRKIATHKRKKKLRKNRHKNK